MYYYNISLNNYNLKLIIINIYKITFHCLTLLILQWIAIDK